MISRIMHRFKFQLNIRAQQYAYVLSQIDDDVPIPYGLNVYIGFIHTSYWRISEDLMQKWLEFVRENMLNICIPKIHSPRWKKSRLYSSRESTSVV